MLLAISQRSGANLHSLSIFHIKLEKTNTMNENTTSLTIGSNILVSSPLIYFPCEIILLSSASSLCKLQLTAELVQAPVWQSWEGNRWKYKGNECTEQLMFCVCYHDAELPGTLCFSCGLGSNFCKRWFKIVYQKCGFIDFLGISEQKIEVPKKSQVSCPNLWKIRKLRKEC